MRNLVAALILLTISVTALTACSRQGGLHAASAGQLQHALNIMNKANRGYATRSKAQKLAIGLQAYRQQTLKKAVQPLQQVIQSGSTSQQVTAAKLLAQIKASQGRYLARQAEDQYGRLQARSGVLVNDAVGVDRASGRARLFEIDNSPAVNKLQRTLRRLEQRQASLQQQIQSERHARQQKHVKVTELRQRSNNLMQQAQHVSRQAFVAKGGKKYVMENEAAKIQSSAANVSFDAARRHVDEQIHTRRLVLLNARHKLVVAAIAMVHQRISQLQGQQKQMDNNKRQAQQQQQQAAQAVAEEFKQLGRAYQGAIAEPFGKARQRIDKAVSLLKTARRQAASLQRQDVELSLLSCYLDQAHTLSSYARVAKGYGDLIALVATGAGKQMPSQAGTLQHALAQIRHKQKTLAQQAADAIAAGRKLAVSLSGAMDPALAIAKAQQLLLSQADRELQTLRTN